jgi:hypothetical protein
LLTVVAAKRPFHDCQIASGAAAHKQRLAHFRRHQPAIEMPRLQAGRGRLPLIPSKAGPRKKTLHLHALLSQRIHERPEHYLTVGLGLHIADCDPGQS